MADGRVVLVAILFCLAPLGGVTADSGQDTPRGLSVVSEPGTAEYLAPDHDGVDRTGQHTASLGVAAAVDSDAGEIRATYDRRTLQREYRNAESATERKEFLGNATRQHSRRVSRFEQQYSLALERYRTGEIAEYELLRVLASLNDEVEATVETTDWLLEATDDLGLDAEHRQLAADRHRLLVLDGPVRDRVSAATVGDAPVRVHAATSGEGLVLATLDDARESPVYVREASDPTALTLDVEDQYRGLPEPAIQRYRELYRWTNNNSLPNMASSGHDEIRLYRFQASHPHGELLTYLDGGSEEILHETQVKDPEQVPTTTTVHWSGDLRLMVERTHAGGPLGVSVSEAGTDGPVDAEVEVNGESVGSTDAEQLWTVAPRGETTVNATHDGDTVSVELDLV